MFFSLCYDLPIVVVLYFVRRFRKKKGCVRRERYGDKAETVFVSCSLLRQRIDIWRRGILCFVSTDKVGPLCIQCDKDEIEILFGRTAAKQTKE